MLIDNRKQVEELLQAMNEHLPIPALATDGLVRSMKRKPITPWQPRFKLINKRACSS